MIAVWLGQQRSQAVGSGFESLSCQIFLRYTLSIFWCPKLVKQWRVPLRCFSALWDKKFSTENLDTSPPLLSINFLATGIFLKHSTERFPYEIFRHCETKKFRRKILILPPPLLSINFFGTRNQYNSKRFPYGNFRHCET